MIPSWMDKVAKEAEKTFARHDVKITIGGEPTFIPEKPDGAEWNYAAVGPTKLSYALKMAEVLIKTRLPGAVRFFCPGKSYPGETNPRWVVRLLANRDGTSLIQLPKRGQPLTPKTIDQFAELLSKNLKVPARWIAFADPNDASVEVRATPLDHEDSRWHAVHWSLPKGERKLVPAEGPTGLRLPLHLMPESMTRRCLSLERKGNALILFFPPLKQEAFLELVAAAEKAANQLSLGRLEFQGYTPIDEADRWTVLGLAADPGVLEINLPACHSWREYAEWLDVLKASAEKVGLRAWKESRDDHPQGSGGGNHLLWGGPNLDDHPFFTRPGWLAAILRYWQHHPSLAYLFTGCYVGASSQAPRPDESARDLYDIEMAYTFLESLPPGDHRALINETLRHIQTDVTGNSHRSEVSFDKFWNTSTPAGSLGLVEFRAIEALPRADWMSAIALLWHCLAAYLLENPAPKTLKRYGPRLLDEYFLPTALWKDLESILSELRSKGYPIDEKIFRDIWNWRFPSLLQWEKAGCSLTVRKALESWPLLCETPVEGGTTSRFVDTSMQRLEFLASPALQARYEVYVGGRPLPLQATPAGDHLAGLRYRRTNLYPSLHPGIPTQLPLHVTLVDKETGRMAAQFEMGGKEIAFHKLSTPGKGKLGGKPCRGGRRTDLTCDLRLA